MKENKIQMWVHPEFQRKFKAMASECGMTLIEFSKLKSKELENRNPTYESNKKRFKFSF